MTRNIALFSVRLAVKDGKPNERIARRLQFIPGAMDIEQFNAGSVQYGMNLIIPLAVSADFDLYEEKIDAIKDHLDIFFQNYIPEAGICEVRMRHMRWIDDKIYS
ncbi:hypothetical protein MYX07_02405 [Patescibacteria group bacterium AH-259-L07]|nr:hypothetical protein [Patescibacteria group bacterium AH-259-L07]